MGTLAACHHDKGMQCDERERLWEEYNRALDEWMSSPPGRMN